MSLIISDSENTESPPAILTKIAQADKSAVLECVDLYGRMIWALAKKYTDSAEEAEQIVPEIFMDIWKNAQFCDLEISDEENWIALIARRRLKNCTPKENYHPSQEIPQEILVKDYGKIQNIVVIAH